jgi:hypothetical protein
MVGGPIIGFYLQQIKNYKFPSTNGQTTPNNFEVWSIFNGQASKCHTSENWDVEYFIGNSTEMSFGEVIHDMYQSNPKAWRIVQHVMHKLMGPPCTIGLHLMNVIEGNQR